MSTGSQRVQHDLVTKQQQHCPYFTDEKTEAQKDLTLAKSQDSGHLSRKPIGLTPHQKTLAASAWGMGKSFCLHACMLSHVRLFNPMNCSMPGSSVRGIFQARITDRLSFPPPGDLPDLVIEPVSPAAPALTGHFFTTELPRKPCSLKEEAIEWFWHLRCGRSHTLVLRESFLLCSGRAADGKGLCSHHQLLGEKR